MDPIRRADRVLRKVTFRVLLSIVVFAVLSVVVAKGSSAHNGRLIHDFGICTVPKGHFFITGSGKDVWFQVDQILCNGKTYDANYHPDPLNVVNEAATLVRGGKWKCGHQVFSATHYSLWRLERVEDSDTEATSGWSVTDGGCTPA